MDKSASIAEHLKSEELALGGWIRSFGGGLIAGVGFVALAFLLEGKIIKAGAKLIR